MSLTSETPVPHAEGVRVDARDGETFKSEMLAACRAVCPDWVAFGDEDVALVQIRGGITNLLYRLDAPDGQKRLIRLYGLNTEVLIDRDHDNRTFGLLSNVGFSPQLFGTFENGRVEQWLEMRALEPQEMAAQQPTDFVSMIGRELARMHALDMPFVKTPKLWGTLHSWLAMATALHFDCPDKAARHRALRLRHLAAELAYLERRLPSPANGFDPALLFGAARAKASEAIAMEAAAFCADTVFCHNDLLSGNIMTADGVDRVQILDYEYGNYNTRAFDIANHFCEHAGFDSDFKNGYPKPAKQMAFLRAYLERIDPKRAERMAHEGSLDEFLAAAHACVDCFAPAAHFFWGIWAVIQARYSPIDFDFMDYARLRFEGYALHKHMFLPASSEDTIVDTTTAAA